MPGQMANKMKVPNHQKKLKLGVEAKQKPKMNQTETDLKFLLKSPTSRRGRGRMGRKRKEISPIKIINPFKVHNTILSYEVLPTK